MLLSSQKHLYPVTIITLSLVTLGLLSACGGGDTVPNNTIIDITKDYQLSTTITGDGAITEDVSGFSCSTSCNQNFKSGAQITLQAVPTSKSKFDGWDGACTGTKSCNLSMTNNQTVTALFSPATANTFQLIVSSSSGGTIKSKLPGIDCGTDCSEIYSVDSSITLTATAKPKYTFIRWSGACSGNQECTIKINKNENVSAYFSSGNMANLCDGLITDKVDHPMTALAKPANGSTVIDPEFGTTIRRISAASTGSVIKPMYSTIQAWNADESYLILYHTKDNKGHHLYDGKTYKYIKKLNFTPADIEQVFWHTLDPDIFMYVDNSSTPILIAYHVSTNFKEKLHVFNGCSRVSSGGDPMFTSWDSDVIGLVCKQSTGQSHLSYRISTQTESTKIMTNNTAAPQSAPSGNLFFYAGNGKSDVLNFNGILQKTLDLGSPFDHASLGMLADGTDMFYGVDFGGAANCKAGALVAHNMVTGSCSVIVGQSSGYVYPPTGTHVSALSHKNPGWVAVSMVGNVNGQTVLNNEIILANTNPGGSVCRVAHHRSWGKSGPQGYWAEPHVVISPSATRLLFGSDWGGGTTVDAYVVELPAYVP